MNKIIISGHTDRQGSREYNLTLSEKRAESVKKVLISEGVTIQIVTQGFGYSQPLDDRDTPDAWEKNRRTEIEFVDVQNKTKLIKELDLIFKN